MDIIEHNNQIINEAELNNLKKDVAKLKEIVKELQREISNLKDEISKKSSIHHKH